MAEWACPYSSLPVILHLLYAEYRVEMCRGVGVAVGAHYGGIYQAYNVNGRWHDYIRQPASERMGGQKCGVARNAVHLLRARG